MRYRINFDKTINQIVPFYIAGRKLILYLQALMSPLQKLNDMFVNYAKETRIEAAMTSQKFKFEWYLNRKFSAYFQGDGKITLSNSKVTGTAIYPANTISDVQHLIFRQEAETEPSIALYGGNELTATNSESFIVNTPPINTSKITQVKFNKLLKQVVDKYRIANKTYTIINSEI